MEVGADSVELRPRSKLVIFEALCFDVAQGRMNGAPNETASK